MNRSLPEVVARRIRRDGPLMVIDLGIVLAAYLVALVIRFDGSVPIEFWGSFWPFMPVVAFFHLTANHVFGLYGRMWRYASVTEARRVVTAGVVAGALVIGASYLGQPLRLLPLSVTVLGATFAFIGFGAVRFQSRLFALRRRAHEGDLHNVLVVGAGDAGAMLLRDLQTHPHLGIVPVGLVDDDPKKLGRSIQGVKVLGDRRTIPSLVERLDVNEVFLAVASATSDLVRDISALCEQENVRMKVLPNVDEIVGGKITARDVRDLQIEDLLGRQQVEIDLAAIAAMVAGRRVLVTGAGGSIGAEIARQIAEFSPGKLTLLDNDETHLHHAMNAMRHAATPVLADIRDRGEIERVFESHGPEVVFHAAALKHVPILESHPREALLTNITGTINVARAAIESGTKRFVLISTDKAVRPVSVMGASKRLAEQAVWTLARRSGVFCVVRFGNVLGSRGSVVPTFFEQIARGGPVTVTDPEMTRYFMSNREAVSLVLQAAALAVGGEVFTLDMGEPVNILDLARNVVRLSGRVPGADIEIEIVGTRPGEKITEDAIDEAERPIASDHPSILVSKPPATDSTALISALAELDQLAQQGNIEKLAAAMVELACGDSESGAEAIGDAASETGRNDAWTPSNT